MKYAESIYGCLQKLLHLAVVLAAMLVAVYGETIPESPLSTQDLFGSWEAVAEFGSALTAVFRMDIVRDGESYLVEERKYPKSIEPHVIARLASLELKDGKLNLKFTTIGVAAPYESIQIIGSAFGGRDNATISGKLTTHRGDYSEVEPITFKRAPFFSALLEASTEAEAEIQRQRSRGNRK